MENNLDLSSVVSLIMQNPEIIAKIAALAKQNPPQSTPSAPEEAAQAAAEEASEEDGSIEMKRKNRERLFSALRPYLSSERAKTLSSVEAMVAIIDSMKV